MKKIVEKVKHLDEFLVNKYHINLIDTLLLNKDKYNKCIEEKDEFDDETLNKIASLFLINIDELKDDDKELPHDDHLKVDELLIQVRLGNYVNETEKNKNKNVIKRNYNLLDKPLKKKLIINTLISFIPFLAIIIYSLVTCLSNTIETMNTYKEGDTLSSSQQAIEDELLKNDETTDLTFANVKVGVTLESINSISSSSSSFNATLSTSFDFDQIEYYKMYYYKSKGVKFNENNFYTSEDLLADNYCFNSEQNGYLEYKDNIPDILQFNFLSNTHMSSLNKPISVSTLYLEQKEAYPGEKSSNIYADKNDEFRIGNGRITADSLEYQDKGTAYFDKTTSSYRYSQKLHYSTTINKTFDSPRYPLDSAQFKIYIQPTRNTNYVRYIANKEISGLSTYFSISDGYKKVNERNGIKNFNVKLNYYQELDTDPSSSTYNTTIIKTQLEVILRANKHGISVYLNSFLNIIAVAIWLILAFYNQSFNKDDSMSMIGTGFFSAISAILLGLSTVGNANIFSLLTFINIFTLAMVLIMGFEIIKCRRYNKLNNANMIAYSNAKVRILFYFLVVCSILIYIVIPAISYLWLL